MRVRGLQGLQGRVGWEDEGVGDGAATLRAHAHLLVAICATRLPPRAHGRSPPDVIAIAIATVTVIVSGAQARARSAY